MVVHLIFFLMDWEQELLTSALAIAHPYFLEIVVATSQELLISALATSSSSAIAHPYFLEIVVATSVGLETNSAPTLFPLYNNSIEIFFFLSKNTNIFFQFVVQELLWTFSIYVKMSPVSLLYMAALVLSYLSLLIMLLLSHLELKKKFNHLFLLHGLPIETLSVHV